MTRRIDRLLIDQHGIDHAAHLDQLLAAGLLITGGERTLPQQVKLTPPSTE